MKRLAPSALTLASTALLLAACGRHHEAGRLPGDSQMQRTIVGTWGVEISNVAGVITLRPDGGFSAYWSNQTSPKGYHFDGYWQITNGTLVSAMTNASYWNWAKRAVLGRESRWKILQLTDEELVFATNNEPSVWRRKN